MLSCCSEGYRANPFDFQWIADALDPLATRILQSVNISSDNYWIACLLFSMPFSALPSQPGQIGSLTEGMGVLLCR
jgi:hypothetical protein